MSFEKTKTRESGQESRTKENKEDSTLDQEIAAGEWTRISQYPAYQRRSRQGRILAVYQAISNRLGQLVKVFYELAREEKSLQAAEKLLEEIKQLREIREKLLFWLTWSKKDKRPNLPDEVEEIVDD